MYCHYAYMIVSAHKAEYGISGFGVSITTMEEVFIKVGEGLDEALEGKLVNIIRLLCLSCIQCFMSGWSLRLKH